MYGPEAPLTIAQSKGLPRDGEVILELIVEEAERDHEQVQEDPNAEEKLPATVVDHEAFPSFLQPQQLDIPGPYGARRTIGEHQALQPDAFWPVSFERIG